MNEVEKELLSRHRKWFDTLRQFICVACGKPTEKSKLGKIAIFRPAKKYKMARTATYMTCDDCEKLPAEEVYKKIEAWLVERGHVEL
jgi:hypothetical protein